MQDEIDSFMETVMEEVRKRMTEAGEAAVAWNKQYGSYKDRTGNLRRSNFYEVTDDALIIGNSAEYAGYVEAKGYMVCTDGALLAEKILNGD